MNSLAVITGASQGLGFALARKLADNRWTLVVNARSAERLTRAVDELGAITEVVAVAGDVSDAAHREELIEAAAALGPIDLVVNNASTLGASPLPALDEIDSGVLSTTFDVNVIAPLALSRLALPHLAPGAVIVNITSDAGVEAYPGWGGYGASKAALEHASRVRAVEHPELRVLVVDPGDMRTEMHQDAFPGEDISDRPTPDESAAGIVQLVTSTAPSGRYLAREQR